MPVGRLLYLRIAEGEPLPDLNPCAPFRAVVVLEAEYSEQWQHEVSEWLVRSGCLYMMAWGPRCTTWDDSVDWASIEEADFNDIPDDKLVMTTWHDGEPLDEVFSFAGSCAEHHAADLQNTIILHVSAADDREGMVARFVAAQDRD